MSHPVIEVIEPARTVIEVHEQAQAVIEVTEAISPPGPAGLSAYQVVLLDGFVGTQSEWLASLVGGNLTEHVNDPTPHTTT
ncbi:hypothetical protein [Sanguibacter sp. 25GB23B1]|uniref:hypothetical protein n=1 Tax=Sanguibacter sp. 25GB23B1 TaxID=3156067 RepID=UPI0032AFC2AF